MNRPILNPAFDVETGDLPEDSQVSIRILTRRALRTLWVMLRFIYRIMAFDLIFWRSQQATLPRTLSSRILRVMLYRLAFAPILLVLICSALVYVGTHPCVPPIEHDPLSLGVYFDAVSFASEEGPKLDGWLVPILDEHRVLADRENVLTHKYPAVLLVHDSGASREQMLPFVKPLHKAGFVVLVLSVRGYESSDRAGVTFGLNESRDLRAAISMLRRRPFINPNWVSVLGIGTGATAAKLAIHRDSSLSSAVLIDPIDTIDQSIATRVAPRSSWLQWMQPLCKWTFEVAYQLDADELDWLHYEYKGKNRTLTLTSGEAARSMGMEAIVDHLEMRHKSAEAHADDN